MKLAVVPSEQLTSTTTSPRSEASDPVTTLVTRSAPGRTVYTFETPTVVTSVVVPFSGIVTTSPGVKVVVTLTVSLASSTRSITVHTLPARMSSTSSGVGGEPAG